MWYKDYYAGSTQGYDFAMFSVYTDDSCSDESEVFRSTSMIACLNWIDQQRGIYES